MKILTPANLSILLCTFMIHFCVVHNNAYAATITVTSTVDAGPGTLRDAIMNASDNDLIVFSAALNNTTLSVISGEILIDKSITITGPGSSLLTLSGFDLGKMFVIDTNKTVVVSGLKFTKGNAISFGEAGLGGVFLNKGTLTINNCIFDDNNANFGGGALANNEAGTLELNGCTLSANTTLTNGGAIFNQGMFTMSSCSILTNMGTFGGAIYTEGESNLTNNYFSQNNATASGAAIQSAGKLTIDQNTFENNSTNSSGGAISADDTVTITNSIFANNMGSIGGGIVINTDGVASITGCNFQNNMVTSSGGAIQNTGILTIDNCTIRGNESDFSGGGIYNSNKLNLTNSTINKNTAKMSGGGVLNIDTLTMNNCVLDSNDAQNGAAFTNDFGGFATLSMNTMRRNTATQSGGAIQNASKMDLTDGTIQFNSASSGGGYFQQDGSSTITNSNITNNSVDLLGGGIYSFSIGGRNELFISGSSINNNTASGQGGGIHNDQNLFSANAKSILEVRNTQLQSNTASGGAGGGVYSRDSIYISQCKIMNNSADTAGGIFMSESRMILEFDTIQGNSALRGGGIYHTNANGSIENTTISSNNASSVQGGGIYNYGAGSNKRAFLDINASTISGNTSFGNGAGVYNLEVNGGSAFISMQNSTISGNIASAANVNYGGGIANEDSMLLNHCTVYLNSASQGGGIHNTENFRMTNTILGGNTGTVSSPDGSTFQAVTSLGYNLIGNNSNFSFTATTGDLVGTMAMPIDPKLNSLANNGGFTLTHLPQTSPNSPVLNAANPTAAFGVDQRNEPRPLNGRADMGSVEVDTTGMFSCGTDPYEPNENSADAKDPFGSSLNPISDAKICPSSDRDWFKFTISDTGRIDVILSDLKANYNIEIYNASITKIAESLNANLAKDSVRLTDSLPGTYFIKVFPQGNAFSDTAYSLRVRFASLTSTANINCGKDSYEPNNTKNDASSIGAIGSGNNDTRLCPKGDVDWFSFNVQNITTTTIKLSNLPKNYDLQLHNANGILGVSSNPGTNDETIIFTPPAAGTYFVQVAGNSDAWDEDPYTLMISTSMTAPGGTNTNKPPASSNTGTGTGNPPIKPPAGTSSTKPSIGSQTNFRTLTVHPEALKVYPNPASDRLNISLTASGEGNLQISLMDMSGRIITSSSQKVEEGASEMILFLPSLSNGMYHLSLKGEGLSINRKIFIRK